NPISSGHKRKCPDFILSVPKKPVPLCVCGHKSTSMTQMKRHRSICEQWKNRDKELTRTKRLESTLRERYGEGVSNPVHIPGVSKRKAATMKKRYGAENPFSRKSSLFQKVQSYWADKDRAAHLPKDNFAKPEIKEKIRQTNLERYGVENPTQNLNIRNKQLATAKKRYGDEQLLRVKEIREKGKQTNLLRLGVPDPAQSPVVLEKIRQTNLERYGVPWTTLGVSREKQYATQVSKYGNKFFASTIGKQKIRKALLDSENVSKDGVRKRNRKLNKPESLVQSLNDRLFYVGHGIFWKYLPSLMGSKNPDFIIPGSDPERPFKNVKQVVEVLGNYWHGPEKTGLQRDLYEEQLILAYADIGISCLIIWEDETWENLSLLKKKIDGFLKAPDSKKSGGDKIEIDFKKLKITFDENLDTYSILNEYHYAGFGRGSSLIVSARIDDRLIAVSKFSPPIRQTISESLGVNSNSLIELDRFCIHPECHVINLASYFMSRVIKLLKKNCPNIETIVSFADPAEGHSGTIYKASNWTEIGKTSHSYFYQLPSGFKMNKKTLFNKSRSSGLGEREYSDKIGAVRVSTPPKIKYIYKL
ncbi:MAG: hypothetical protein WBC02_00325, partial [Candidatus Aminicenantaceae bacterium]